MRVVSTPERCPDTAPITAPRVILPDISHAFHESPRPVLMPESYLLSLLASASGGKIRIRPRYSRQFRTKETRERGRSDLLFMFFDHRAPLGYLQDFLLELVNYRGGDDWMIRFKGAFEEFLREDEEHPGRSLGQSMPLLHAVREGRRDPSLDQKWAGNHSLLAEYFMGAALLWRLRRDGLLTPRDHEILEDLAVAASVDEARCDVITQILRLQCLPWRDGLTITSYDPPNRGEKRTLSVLDLLIELFWGALDPIPESLKKFAAPDDTPITLRNRLKELLREVAALDVSAYHVLNPGFAYYPPKELNLAFVRSVGRDGVNTFVLVVLKGDRVIKRSLVPTHIHPTVLDFRLKPGETAPRPMDEPPAPWSNLEDARLDLFLDEKDHRYKINLTYVVAGGTPMPLLESTIIDVERLLDFLEDQPVQEVSEWQGLDTLPENLRKVETRHAKLVVAEHRQKQNNRNGTEGKNGKNGKNGTARVTREEIFVTDPVHPLLIPENRDVLLSLGLPCEVYEDPNAAVKDAARTRQKICFGEEKRVVDIWEFRSKLGGDLFMDTPLYRGRFQNPEPSWIGRVALDPETSQIVAVPVMCVEGRWMFRPYLFSEDRFAWIGGSSQRGVVDLDVLNPVTGESVVLPVGMNVIHTTEEVPPMSLPYWLQPTKPKPHIPIWKYELRITLELNAQDPFAEPLLYGGTAATPRRIDDWVGWVGRVKFNNNFSVRTLKPVREGDSAQERRIFEFLMAGGDHVVQHAWCEFEALRPLELPWDAEGNLALPPLTPFYAPLTREFYHSEGG
ncbi:MAG: hypothetical protein KY468_12520 [Armatimonadetes bacterium]|nr:hypothetical protein [Armatimonadota bacterium]